MAHNVHVIDHPLVQHKLTLLRKKETSTTSFRRLLNEIGSLMAYEVTRDLPLRSIDIETPLESMRAEHLAGDRGIVGGVGCLLLLGGNDDHVN